MFMDKNSKWSLSTKSLSKMHDKLWNDLGRTSCELAEAVGI